MTQRLPHNLLSLAVAIVMLTCCARSSASDAQPLTSEITRNAVGATGNASVRIGLSALSSTDRLVTLWPSDTGYTPRVGISHISIAVDEEAMFVPSDAILSVFDPNAVRLRADGPEFLLEIDGGDGAESYRVKIWFDETRVTRRQMTTFEDEVLQTTQYNLVVTE